MAVLGILALLLSRGRARGRRRRRSDALHGLTPPGVGRPPLGQPAPVGDPRGPGEVSPGATLAPPRPLVRTLSPRRPAAIRHRNDRATLAVGQLLAKVSEGLAAGLDEPAALHTAAGSSRGPGAPLLRRVGTELRQGHELATILREGIAEERSPSVRWAALALSTWDRTGGQLRGIVEVASRTIADRALVSAALRSLRRRERIAGFIVGGTPFVVAATRTALDTGWFGRAIGSIVGVVTIVGAFALAVAGAWWLRRVGRAPLGPMRGRWAASRIAPAPDPALLDALDRAALYDAAGLGVDEALAQGAGDAGPRLAVLLRSAQRIHDSGSARGTAVLEETVRLRNERRFHIALATRRVPVASVLPALTLVLPATLLVLSAGGQ